MGAANDGRTLLSTLPLPSMALQQPLGPTRRNWLSFAFNRPSTYSRSASGLSIDMKYFSNSGST